MRVGNVDGAVLARLQSDAPLMAIATDGVWYGNGANAHATRFVTVTRIDGHTEWEFGDEAWIELPYQIRCVIQSSSATQANDAAARIHAVLNRQEAAITATGFLTMCCALDFPIRYDQLDTANPDIRWQHAGGQYRLWVVPTGG